MKQKLLVLAKELYEPTVFYNKNPGRAEIS